MEFTEKQLAVLRHKPTRFSFYTGATRAGKTVVSFYVLIREIANHYNGNILLVGKTLATFSRNVLDEMRKIFGEKHIGYMRSDATGGRIVTIFGKDCYCVSAFDNSSENIIRGMSVSLAYCDEIVTYPESFFIMLGTRLDKADSRLIATANPAEPSHYIKQFIDKEGLDTYSEHFSIYDNTFLDPIVIKSMENQYRGTIFFDRYILGNWVRTEGLVYPLFKREKHFLTPDQFRQKYGSHRIRYVIWGGDGANTNDATAIEPLAILDNGQGVVLEPFYHSPKINGQLSNEQLIPYIKRYLMDMQNRYHFQEMGVTHYMPMDCGAADLVLSLAFNLPNYYNVQKYTKKDLLQTSDVVNNALGRDSIIVLDFGGYYNYIQNRFESGIRQLVVDLESMIWDQNNPSKFDDKVPNDTADAFRYAVCSYYLNPMNLWATPGNDIYKENSR